MISAFDIFKIGIGPSSSHTVGPMNAGKSFIDRLESSGLLTATSHIVVDLYGSLSLTGKGHATDVAIIMGLAGNSPQDVVIDEIPAFIELVTRSGRLPVASGAHIVDFPVAKNIIFHPEMLPRHENGMRITAWKAQECVAEGEQESPLTVLSRTTLAEILKFVNEVPFAAIRFILDSAKLNCALSQEGLSGKWGLHIGATLEKQCARGLLAKDLSSSIVIRTSAASDARMGGATLPAMSNSGSGNQGITATMPVVVVAEHFGADDERLARALMLSHLSAIYIHNQLPRLSALCAATTAAMGAAAGMAWLVDGRYETISMAISSMIGDVSGMICDGASNSCAMKVSTSASAAWKAVLMALDDTAVTGNEGIVAHDVEQSIANLCALASHSMQQTDRQIIEIMASKAR
ncbi:hypothetical protein H5P60_001104 [Escherichia coli]|nr:hypothetical protein [Escherichia coli]